MAQAKKIVILTGFTLAWNPRVLKEASALAAAGYRVNVLGAAPSLNQFEVDKKLAARGGFTVQSIICFNRHGDIGKGKHLGRRLRSKFAVLLFQWLGRESPLQLGLITRELWKSSRHQTADFYSVHLESALWVGRRLIEIGKVVGIDMEDWYSEDLLPEARKHRPLKLLRNLEGELLRRTAHSSCPSLVMRKALAAKYDCRPPAVIYNAFPWTDRDSLDGIFKDRRNLRVPSIHWYSQTLGHGRGLEDLFEALPYLNHEVEIHLRGKPVSGFDAWLASLVPEPLRSRIHVHDLVSNEELLSRIAEHDIGFAGEMKYSRSRDLTVTNKILQYLLAGLAVVASDTAGQREVADQAPGAVFIYPSGDSQDLAKQLNLLLGDKDLLAKSKSLALAAARKSFCWERVAPKLVEGVQQAITEAG